MNEQAPPANTNKDIVSTGTENQRLAVAVSGRCYVRRRSSTSPEAAAEQLLKLAAVTGHEHAKGSKSFHSPVAHTAKGALTKQPSKGSAIKPASSRCLLQVDYEEPWSRTPYYLQQGLYVIRTAEDRLRGKVVSRRCLAENPLGQFEDAPNDPTAAMDEPSMSVHSTGASVLPTNNAFSVNTAFPSWLPRSPATGLPLIYSTAQASPSTPMTKNHRFPPVVATPTLGATTTTPGPTKILPPVPGGGSFRHRKPVRLIAAQNTPSQARTNFMNPISKPLSVLQSRQENETIRAPRSIPSPQSTLISSDDPHSAADDGSTIHTQDSRRMSAKGVDWRVYGMKYPLDQVKTMSHPIPEILRAADPAFKKAKTAAATKLRSDEGSCSDDNDDEEDDSHFEDAGWTRIIPVPSKAIILPDMEHAIREDDILDSDILLGRGSRVNEHVGNKWFRHVCGPYRLAYTTAQRRQKYQLTLDLVHYFRACGSRFLEKDGSLWYEQGDDRGAKKVGQNLREGAPERIRTAITTLKVPHEDEDASRESKRQRH
jgi:hypothetical protein